MLVTVDLRRVVTLILPNAVVHGDVLEVDVELDVLVLGLLPLDAHHLLDGLSDVEHLVVVSELVALDLGKVQHILDYEVHQLSRVLLDDPAVIQLLKDLNALFKSWVVPKACFKLLE